MQKWEYIVVWVHNHQVASVDDKNVEELSITWVSFLAEKGREGWELGDTIGEDRLNFCAHLKRPIEGGVLSPEEAQERRVRGY